MAKEDPKWMSHLRLKRGSLRKTLGVKAGHNIPADKLESAPHSNNPLTRKRAVLAETFRKARH